MGDSDSIDGGELAWGEIVDAAETDDISPEEVCASDLRGINYSKLLNVGRSAEVDVSDSPTKGELVDRLAEERIFMGAGEDNEFYRKDDGEIEHVELLDVQTPSGQGSGRDEPKDKTILYGLTRAETTEPRVEEIRHALEEQGKYELREAGSGDKFAIVLPAENDPEQEHLFEETDGEEDEEPAEEVESGEESDSSDEADGDEGDEEETDEEPEEEDESEGTIPREVARERLLDQQKTELYSTAKELDIDGRSDMTKDELAEAIMDEREQVADE